jgi:hypothetical protein
VIRRKRMLDTLSGFTNYSVYIFMSKLPILSRHFVDYITLLSVARLYSLE